MKIRCLTALGPLILTLATVVPAPTASAAPAPWNWTRVTRAVSVAPTTSYQIQVFCPAGFSAITGGLALPQSSGLAKTAEYRASNGSYWQVDFRNDSSSSGSASVVAECAQTSQLPVFSHRLVEFTRATNWSGRVSCPNPGEVVVTGGVDWSDRRFARIHENGPRFGGEEAWTATGRNSNSNAIMAIEVYCVDPSQVPGYRRVEQARSTVNTVATCPTGTRVLSGGSAGGTASSSHPARNTWTVATSPYYSSTGFVRAICVSAGTPEVAIEYASPGSDGAKTKQTYVTFRLTGRDPAGFPSSFRCSVDGSPPAPCSSNPQFGPFSDGPHQFSVFNQTADGRTSNLVTYRWTVDATAPTATAPRLAAVSLGNPVTASWSATDAGSGIAWHEAALWRARPDGSVADWIQLPGWDDLATPSVQLPALAAGETACVSVRAGDFAGNRSAWTAPACTSRPLDDRALTAVTTGWTRATGTSYWLQTVTQTTASSRQLRRTNLPLTQVGVLATVCPGCGTVDIAVAGTTVGRISTDLSTTAHRRVLLLPAFTLRTGDVTVTTVTANRSVRIDGLIAIRATTTRPVF